MKLIYSVFYLFYDSASAYGFRIHTNHMSTNFDTNGAIWSEYSSMLIEPCNEWNEIQVVPFNLS